MTVMPLTPCKMPGNLIGPSDFGLLVQKAPGITQPHPEHRLPTSLSLNGVLDRLACSVCALALAGLRRHGVGVALSITTPDLATFAPLCRRYQVQGLKMVDSSIL